MEIMKQDNPKQSGDESDEVESEQKRIKKELKLTNEWRHKKDFSEGRYEVCPLQ